MTLDRALVNLNIRMEISTLGNLRMGQGKALESIIIKDSLLKGTITRVTGLIMIDRDMGNSYFTNKSKFMRGIGKMI